MKFKVPVKTFVEVEVASAAEARSLAHAVYSKLSPSYESAEDAVLGKRSLVPHLVNGAPVVEVGKPIAVKEVESSKPLPRGTGK